jgi:hypothetical protein
MGGAPRHNASLNRALNEALRIHGGPAWRVFQVRSCLSVFCSSSFLCCFCALFSCGVALTSWRSPVLVR